MYFKDIRVTSTIDTDLELTFSMDPHPHVTLSSSIVTEIVRYEMQITPIIRVCYILNFTELKARIGLGFECEGIGGIMGCQGDVFLSSSGVTDL
jgi:hypothetical protein